MDEEKSISFFDLNTYVGRRGRFRGRFFWRVEDLVSALDKAGIERALVCHTLIKEFHPREGNDEVVKAVADHSSLFPSWGILPPAGLNESPDLPAVDDFILKMKNNGVKAVRIFPDDTQHRFILSEWSMGEIYLALEEVRIPLIIDFGQDYREVNIDWEKVYEICSNHPGLPVILIGVGYRSLRKLIPIFRACPNLRIELSRFMVHRGIEFICREFEPGRLLFGSRLPFQNPGSIMAVILYANISFEEKQLIAGLNLQKLFDDIRW